MQRYSGTTYIEKAIIKGTGKRLFGILPIISTVAGLVYRSVSKDMHLADSFESKTIKSTSEKILNEYKATQGNNLPAYFQRGKGQYPTHVPLFLHERAILFVGSAIGSLLYPENNNYIVTLGETSATNKFLIELRNKMLNDENGRLILRNKPHLTSTTLHLKELENYPKKSFGYHYFKWLSKNKVSPDTRVPVKFIDDAELAYVFQRYRETHDFVHTLLDMPVSREGEIAIKWFEWLHFGVPFAGMGAIFAPWNVKTLNERERLFNIYYPIMLENAINLQRGKICLVNFNWEKILHEDIDLFREKIGIKLGPDMKKLRKLQITNWQQVKQLDL
ncbi:ubiquinone biosynthesis protein [Martiniozyma asiatica (nom. inval.)]|nr:ubiquinone biosynthesis protein [Martiniozyma asiatica]